MNDFDVIVLGVGGIGSAACYELARRGVRVLGLDRFPLVHDRGSSHGESRIIRKAYFEHPDYVPLLHRAYEGWHELENASQQTLFRPNGLVLSGLPDGDTIKGARLSAEIHGLELHNFTSAEARRRFPGFEFPANHDIAFEPGAGTLFVEACVQAQIDQAIRYGATLRGNERVIEWTSDGVTIDIRTDSGEYSAEKLVIAAGAWAGDCLKEIGLPLKVVRKFVGWFPISTNHSLSHSGTPTFFFELPEGTFYGFPSFDSATVKVAEHSGGELVRDPASVDRTCRSTDLTRLQTFLAAHLPDVGLNPVKHSICLYTMTPDQHFIIDVHPNYKNVSFAGGFSGHGFKFCPVVGEALADLTLSGTTAIPIKFLSCNRASLQLHQN